ncbi:MAG: putative reductase [Devosia sp.]|uniref:NADPH-dependent FMN reductase n=1 Tax=Devosia sp. TaxID=1871048 RepID=UPI002619891E|nr:NADPH-dependent FMN reductase [Devosia sp.]MDB5527707.1 putative reductase [Devosia sp.]
MTTKPKIAIILGTTRPTRFADKPAEWLMNIAKARDDATYEIVDLRDYPMPFFEEAGSPMFVPPQNAVALAWGRKVAEFDGYIFVTAEYNHSMPAVLKNALDYAYAEFGRKPATFVAYGGVGGARAVEQLRLVVAELHMTSLKHTVHIGATEFVGMLMQGKSFADYPYLDDAASMMLDHLAWWTNTLRAGRELAAVEPFDHQAALKAAGA